MIFYLCLRRLPRVAGNLSGYIFAKGGNRLARFPLRVLGCGPNVFKMSPQALMARAIAVLVGLQAVPVGITPHDPI